MSKKPELVSTSVIQGDWEILAKIVKQNGKNVISEIRVFPHKSLPVGGLKSSDWRKIKISQSLFAFSDPNLLDKAMANLGKLIESIKQAYKESNYEKNLIKFLHDNWDRNGPKLQSDLIYAKLSVAYVLFTLIYKNRGMTTLAERLKIPRQTLISRIQKCYELGFLEKGKDGHFYSMGKQDIRWSLKTSKSLNKDMDPIEASLAFVFKTGEKNTKGKKNEYKKNKKDK